MQMVLVIGVFPSNAAGLSDTAANIWAAIVLIYDFSPAAAKRLEKSAIRRARVGNRALGASRESYSKGLDVNRTIFRV